MTQKLPATQLKTSELLLENLISTML